MTDEAKRAAQEVRDALAVSACRGWAHDNIWKAPTVRGIDTYTGWIDGEIARATTDSERQPLQKARDAMTRFRALISGGAS